MGKYDDIIDMKNPELHHKRMSTLDRAAQFASFAALTGHEEMLENTAFENDRTINERDLYWHELPNADDFI
ncbi:MAG: hypothetical protein K6E56_03710 [Lachnospiraceae bacterium]|nr:hypothetical protein [Lachnospiraceae bacterium]